MTLTQLEEQVSALKEYTRDMPKNMRNRYTVRTRPAGSIVHQKSMELGYFGVVVLGGNHVINGFRNRNVYVIEGNKVIDFIGEVTILARIERTSVTIEVITDDVVACISRRDVER